MSILSWSWISRTVCVSIDDYYQSTPRIATRQALVFTLIMIAARRRSLAGGEA